MEKEYGRLIDKAQQVRQFSYAPYSHYAVGACVLTEEGEVFTGCNVENVSYGLTMCAERVAIGTAVTAGFQNFKAIAIVGDELCRPCGACRQVLFEFGKDIIVIMADSKGNYEVTPIAELLPEAFVLEKGV
ncbi:MAG: cytidine deaminase [Limnochordia bacterium]|nr:cytidine deaminase [Limnochordia bacterium]MDD2628713.1 cytidine deaminase [Limnochordia bacterium]MDD4517056.1 cytidine deaminase [Limnochordia bacterium]